jgi:hypothetical protein
MVTNMAESYKEGCGSKRVVLLMMMMISWLSSCKKKRALWKSKIHHDVHQSPPVDFMLSQLDLMTAMS